jgi:hypothetical protein
MLPVFTDMGNFVPIQTQIRKIIYEKFNDPEKKFTNDEIFEILKNNGDVDKSWTIDDMEKYFLEICDSGLVRNIAQNFTTIWFKIFDSIDQIQCKSCNHEIHLGKSESRICTNPDCKATI